MRNFILSSMALMLAIPAVAAEKERLCVSNRAIKDTRFSAEGYFVKTGTNWYKNAANGCSLFASDRAVRVQGITNRQCNGDQVDVFQTVTALGFGTCTLATWEHVAEDAVPKN